MTRKCLRLFVRHSPSPFLSAFWDLGTFSCILWKKPQKSSKMLNNYFVDFKLILYQKVKIYFLLSKKHPLASIEVMQLNVSVLKCYFGNLFWTLFYNPDQCASVGRFYSLGTLVFAFVIEIWITLYSFLEKYTAIWLLRLSFNNVWLFDTWKYLPYFLI